MAAHQRRLVIGLGLLVAALLLGRWGSGFLTDRLWEASVSEAAAVVGTRWALLAGGLEVAGVLVAALWFIAQLLAAARLTFPLERGSRGRLEEVVSPAVARWVLVGLGLVLGIAVGGGTGQWVLPVVVALRGVTYGSLDPLLGADLGTYVAGLPLWRLLYERAVLLVLPALIAVTVLHVMGGTLRIVNRRLWLAPRARWQFAILLAAAALVIGWGRALVPFELAGQSAGALPPSEFLLRTTVAQLEAVFAATTAVLSFVWGVRTRFVVALGGWVALGLAVLGGAILVSSRNDNTPLGAAALAELRRVDTIAFGFRTADPPRDSTGRRLLAQGLGPALWDASVVARLAAVDSTKVVHQAAGAVRAGTRDIRAWFILRETARGDVTLVALADDHTSPAGGPVSIRFGDSLFAPGLVSYAELGRHEIRPGLREPDVGPETIGIPLSSVGRRIAVAWALQTPSPFRARADDRIGWRLDPVERLEKIAPFAAWGRPRVRFVGAELHWESDGFLVDELFPSSRRVHWRGAPASRVRAAFVGLVSARTGAARVFIRPDADSLARAWEDLAAPLVEGPERMPSDMGPLEYPSELFPVHTEVLAGPSWIGHSIARFGRSPYPSAELGWLGRDTDPLGGPYVSESGREISSLVVGHYGAHGAVLVPVEADTANPIGAPAELQQRWERFPWFQQLRDSIHAAGADLVAGVIRYRTLGDTLIAYQPNYAVGPSGRTTVVLVNVAAGSRLGAGRGFDEAWSNLRAETAPSPVGRDGNARLGQARLWLGRAESALRRGDLQEFGRAFAFLREILDAADTTQDRK